MKGFGRIGTGRQRMLLFILFCLTAAACAQNIRCAEAKSRNTSLAVYVGQSVKIKEGSNQKLSWVSKNKKIATVTGSGKVKAKRAGTTKVIGKSKNGKNQVICKVKVGNYITGIKLKSASSVTLSIDGTSQVKAAVQGKNPLYTGFTYTSSDREIVTVSDKGEMKAVGGGLAEVTVRTQAVNKKGKRYQQKIAVFVQDTATAPVPTEIPAPASDSAVVIGGTPAAPTSAPENPANPAPTDSGTDNTLIGVIAKIPSPSADQLTAAELVVRDAAGNISTLYFLNREYTGNMQIELFGYPFGSGSTVPDALRKIIALGKAGSYVRQEGVRVMHASVDYGKCAVRHLATEETVYFQVYETDTVYGTPYGLIIAQGDTRDKVVVK